MQRQTNLRWIIQCYLLCYRITRICVVGMIIHYVVDILWWNSILYTYRLQECNIGNCHLEKTTVDRNKNKTIYIIVISQNICIVFSMIFVIVHLHVLPLAKVLFFVSRGITLMYMLRFLETVGLIINMSNN